MQDPCLMRNKAIVKINLQKDILRINHLKPYLVDFDIKCPSYVNVPLWFCFSWLASLGFNIKIFDLNSTSECIRDFNKYKLIRWFDTSITASKNTIHFKSGQKWPKNDHLTSFTQLKFKSLLGIVKCHISAFPFSFRTNEKLRKRTRKKEGVKQKQLKGPGEHRVEGVAIIET